MTDSDVKQPVDAVIARALAPVAELLALVAEMPVRPQRMLFLKGQHVDAELTEATKCWNISFSKHPSKTAPDGCILEIHEAERVKPAHRSG
jgi:16S rRNA (guanine527-N7)-methyltransferase